MAVSLLVVLCRRSLFRGTLICADQAEALSPCVAYDRCCRRALYTAKQRTQQQEAGALFVPPLYHPHIHIDLWLWALNSVSSPLCMQPHSRQKRHTNNAMCVVT